MEKRRNCSFLLFSTIFCYLLLDFLVKTGTRFSLRDKRLFEINEIDCISEILLPATLPRRKRDSSVVSALASIAGHTGIDSRLSQGNFWCSNTLSFMSSAGMA